MKVVRFLLRILVCSWRGHRVRRYQHQEVGLAQTLVYCERCHLPLEERAIRVQYPLRRS